jgi:glycosyltransferase involved in cell wall biosynthesis
MALLFDLTGGQPSSGERYHGGGKYTNVLFKNLVRRKTADTVYYLVNRKKEMNEDIDQTVKEQRLRTIDIRGKQIENILNEKKISSFYTAMPYKYTETNFEDVESLVTVHGLRQIEIYTGRYEYIYKNSAKERLELIAKLMGIRNARSSVYKKYNNIIYSCNHNGFIVPSNHTKYSLIDKFPNINTNKVSVCYSPIDEMSNEVDETKNCKNGKYFLIVSAGRWRKNAYRAAIAFDGLIDDNESINCDMILTGVNNKEVFSAVKNRSHFTFKKYVSREELELLYKNAHALVYPSLNEGFGYPPLEAMRYGTPVLASAAGAITEICGDAPLYFDPRSTQEMRNRMLTILLENGIEKQVRSASKRRFVEVKKKSDKMLDSLVHKIENL